MPFRIINALVTFRRAIDIILSIYKLWTCHVYLYDITIFSKSMEDHFMDVERILKKMQEAGVTLM